MPSDAANELAESSQNGDTRDDGEEEEVRNDISSVGAEGSVNELSLLSRQQEVKMEIAALESSRPKELQTRLEEDQQLDYDDSEIQDTLGEEQHAQGRRAINLRRSFFLRRLPLSSG